MSYISSLCRTCMTNVLDNEDIFYYNIFNTADLASKLMSCSNANIQPYDKYPPNVCNTCCTNILDFCDFRDMCGESLAKFDKILEKHVTTFRRATAVTITQPQITEMELSSDNMATSIVKEIADKVSDHRTILVDHTYSTPKNTVGELIEIKSECESIVSEDHHVNDTTGSITGCERDYVRSWQDVEVCSIEGNSCESDAEQEMYDDDKSVDEAVGKGICYENMLQAVGPVEELRIITSELDTYNMKSADSKANDCNICLDEVDCVSLHSEAQADLDLFEGIPEHEESITDINVAGTKHITQAAYEVNFSEYESGDESTTLLRVDLQLKQQFEYNKYRKHKPEDNLANCTLRAFVDTEQEAEYIFEDNAEDEEHVYTAEDDSNEKKSTQFCAPQICPNSDINRPARKLKASIGYFCDLCPRTFILKERLIAHKRVHQGLPGYKCPRNNCPRSFCRSLELRQHIDHEHDNIPRPIYKCDRSNCELRFTSKSGLRIHLRKHHGNGPPLPDRNFVCETCGKSFKNAHKFRIHQYLHVDDTLWPFKCDVEGCTKRFRSKENFKVHKYRHNGIKPYVCTYCDKTFCTSTNLNAHLNYHTLAKKWHCSFCPKVCYTPGLLKHHIRQKHENNPDTTKYPCRLCDKLLSSQSSRKTHEKKHKGEKPYACDECDKRVFLRSSLLVHNQTHIPKTEGFNKFRCDICSCGLFTSASMHDHKIKHSEERPFECSICALKIINQSSVENLCKESKITAGKHSDSD